MEESNSSKPKRNNVCNISGSQESSFTSSRRSGEAQLMSCPVHTSKVKVVHVTCKDSEKTNEQILKIQSSNTIPLLLIHNSSSLVIETHDLTKLERSSDIHPSMNSLNIASKSKPQSLFKLALSKLNENSFKTSLINRLSALDSPNVTQPIKTEQPKTVYIEPSPPDSLNSAPPSYSFVLRQMAARRRPRLMGTFIPSPSYVQHPPPPNYGAPFDIYVDNTHLLQRSRNVVLGFTSVPVQCSECGLIGMSVVRSQTTLCTHLVACSLCLMCCWVCAPLPYMISSCKDIHHYCRNCRHYIGLYSLAGPAPIGPSRRCRTTSRCRNQ